MNNIKKEHEELLIKYCTARIDIKNYGNTENDVHINYISDETANISKPSWFKTNEGIGTKIESIAGSLKFEFKCIHSGTLKITLGGIDCRDKNNNRFPVYIDYFYLKINNEEIIKNHTLTWHDEHYSYEKEVQDNEIITIFLEWKPFNNLNEYKNPLLKKIDEYKTRINAIPRLTCTSIGASALNGKLIYRNWHSPSHLSLWEDINGSLDNIWFSKYIKNKFPNEDFKINIFGPFGVHDNINSEMSGKKVFYTEEDLNFRFLEMKKKFDKYALNHVDLAMGFDLINHPRYLRFPNWLRWNFSPYVTDEEIEKTIDKWNSLDYEKSYDVVNISRHDNWNTRSIIANDIQDIVNITFGGRWRNNSQDLWEIYKNNKIAFISKFKFNLCAENLIDTGYVTEKIFDSINSDCIPLYAGGGNYLEPEVLNQKAILRWYNDENIDNSDTIELFKNLLTDEKTYNEFKNQNRLLESSKKYIINKFSKLEKHFERLIYD